MKKILILMNKKKNNRNKIFMIKKINKLVKIKMIFNNKSINKIYNKIKLIMLTWFMNLVD